MKTSTHTLSVLFVDDEPKIISGLVRNVGMLADDWDVSLAASAAQALEIMGQRKIDVVVSDLRMPGMNGYEFLAITRQRHPSTLRFILTGYASEELMLKAAGIAHRCIAKPCDTRVLVQSIRQVVENRRVLGNKRVARFVNETTELHAGNKPLQDILSATNDPECNLATLARIIESQPTVHVSVLQMANTAFFGSGGSVETIDDALQMLGMDFVRNLAILELTKSRIQLSPPLHALMEAILRHSVETSQVARQMKFLAPNIKMLQTLGSMALLHDLGKLVLLVRRKEEYAELCQSSLTSRRPLWVLERELYGCDHASVGAYLLHLWGLPKAIIKGVAWHHQPDLFCSESVCPVSLLHFTNEGAHQLYPTPEYTSGSLDLVLAKRLGVKPGFHLDLN